MAPSCSTPDTNMQLLSCNTSLVPLSPILGWLRWSRKTQEGSAVRSEKHSRNAVRVTLPGGGRASPHSRGACAPDCCGCRKGSVSSSAVFDLWRVLGARQVSSCSDRGWAVHCCVFGSGCDVCAVLLWEMRSPPL